MVSLQFHGALKPHRLKAHGSPLRETNPTMTKRPVRDRDPGGGGTTAPPTGIFALPPGARTGDCLHKILEQFDFTAAADSPANARLVKEKLAAYGLSGRVPCRGSRRACSAGCA